MPPEHAVLAPFVMLWSKSPIRFAPYVTRQTIPEAVRDEIRVQEPHRWRLPMLIDLPELRRTERAYTKKITA